MLNNGLFFSLLISALSTGIIYFVTNRKEYTYESNYDNKELLKIFTIIFSICFSINYLKNKNFNVGPNNQNPMRSGESLLTHSSRPPF